MDYLNFATLRNYRVSRATYRDVRDTLLPRLLDALKGASLISEHARLVPTGDSRFAPHHTPRSYLSSFVLPCRGCVTHVRAQFVWRSGETYLIAVPVAMRQQLSELRDLAAARLLVALGEEARRKLIVIDVTQPHQRRLSYGYWGPNLKFSKDSRWTEIQEPNNLLDLPEITGRINSLYSRFVPHDHARTIHIPPPGRR